MNLYPECFEAIKSGRKTIEGRARSEKRDYEKMKSGDTIVFTNTETKENFGVKVEMATHYQNVEEMLKKEGLSNVQPNAKTVQEGIKKYYAIENYEERIKKDGIYAIKVCVANKVMITTIIFDIGGVLVNGSFDEFLRKVSEILEANTQKNNEFEIITADWMRGKFKFKEFIEKISGKTISEEDNEKIFELWINNWKLDLDMVAFAKKFKPKYKVVMLSNADREGVEKSGNDPYLNFFDQKFLSYDLGMVKPDREIYEHVIKEIGDKPEDCVFIDNRLENIEAAEKFGIHGIVFENKEQLKKDLKELGVTVE